MLNINDWVLTYSKNDRSYDTRKIVEYVGRVTNILSRDQYEVDVLVRGLSGPRIMHTTYHVSELTLIEPTTKDLEEWSLGIFKK